MQLYVKLGRSHWPHAQLDVTAGPGKGSPRLWRYALLLAVFVLWVNVDEWFLLGPVLAALFWLGERLRGPRRTPGWLAPAGLAVCLLKLHA